MNFLSKSAYVLGFMMPKTERNKALAFMGKNGLTSYPGEYSLKYRAQQIQAHIDSSNKLPYVTHNGKKLYFPEHYTLPQTAKTYKALIIEQDEQSAHRYVKSYNELKDKTLLDIGSAEGIFSFDTVELCKHVYLFECDEIWIKALEATFKPWENKVTIVKKYVSDKLTANEITIDSFLADKEKDNLFLKMDIEGAEKSALKGAENTLKTGKNIGLAVCTYHKPEDPKEISGFLSSMGYSYEFTDGMMYWGRRLNKGVIRAHN